MQGLERHVTGGGHHELFPKLGMASEEIVVSAKIYHHVPAVLPGLTRVLLGHRQRPRCAGALAKLVQSRGFIYPASLVGGEEGRSPLSRKGRRCRELPSGTEAADDLSVGPQRDDVEGGSEMGRVWSGRCPRTSEESQAPACVPSRLHSRELQGTWVSVNIFQSLRRPRMGSCVSDQRCAPSQSLENRKQNQESSTGGRKAPGTPQGDLSCDCRTKTLRAPASTESCPRGLNPSRQPGRH